MGTPAYKVKLRASGTPTASTGNTFSPTSVTNQYQIGSTTRRVWDRKVTPSNLKDANSSAISSTDISSVDYLFGKITFNTTHGATVTADLTYLPMSSTAVAGANSFTLTQSAELLDDTDFSTTGFRSRVLGLRDTTLSISSWTPLNFYFWDAFVETTGSTVIVVEIQTESTGPIGRGFFKLSQDSYSGDIAGLEQEDIELSVDASSKASFAWSDL